MVYSQKNNECYYFNIIFLLLKTNYIIKSYSRNLHPYIFIPVLHKEAKTVLLELNSNYKLTSKYNSFL